MTTKPKARKFRIKRTTPLGVEGSENHVANRSVPREAEDLPRPQARATQEPLQTPAQNIARQGAVDFPQQVKAETDIDAIRREGLTGRQLRMARRMAQKHGLAPISDFDAVRQLRLKGIDPFQSSNMLELVVPTKDGEDDAEMGTVLPGMGKIQLPQTIKPASSQVPQTEVYTADRRAMEITGIQRDIASRRRKRLALLLARLSAFVFLPTILAGWYYYAIATPMYSTKSEFLIQSADGGGGGGPLSGLIPSQLANSQESIAVQSYLTSKDAMIQLDEALG